MKQLVEPIVVITVLLLFPASVISQENPEKQGGDADSKQRQVIVRFRDGSVSKGTLTNRNKFQLKTDYGTLSCSLKEIVKVRVSRFTSSGKRSRDRVVSDLIEKLGARSLSVRQRAKDKLRNIGGMAISTLKEYKNDVNLESSFRISQILEEFKRKGILSRTPHDVVMGSTFALKGWLSLKKLTVKTKGGVMEVENPRTVETIEVPGRKMKPELKDNQLVLQTRTGSTIIGSLARKHIPFKTPYGSLTVPVSELEFLVRKGDGRYRFKARHCEMGGSVTTKNFRLRSEIGTLKISTGRISRISRNWKKSLATGIGTSVERELREPGKREVRVIVTVADTNGNPVPGVRVKLEDRGGTPDNRYKKTKWDGKVVFYEGVGPPPPNRQTVKLPQYGKRKSLGYNNGGVKLTAKFTIKPKKDN